jgi:hypothetical protein
MKDNRKALEELLPSLGYTQDSYGHWKKQGIMAILRIKMQDKSCRLEKQWTRSDGTNEWMKLDGAYYSKLVFEDSTVKIGRYKLKKGDKLTTK